MNCTCRASEISKVVRYDLNFCRSTRYPERYLELLRLKTWGFCSAHDARIRAQVKLVLLERIEKTCQRLTLQ